VPGPFRKTTVSRVQQFRDAGTSTQHRTKNYVFDSKELRGGGAGTGVRHWRSV